MEKFDCCCCGEERWLSDLKTLSCEHKICKRCLTLYGALCSDSTRFPEFVCCPFCGNECLYVGDKNFDAIIREVGNAKEPKAYPGVSVEEYGMPPLFRSLVSFVVSTNKTNYEFYDEMKNDLETIDKRKKARAFVIVMMNVSVECLTRAVEEKTPKSWLFAARAARNVQSVLLEWLDDHDVCNGERFGCLINDAKQFGVLEQTGWRVVEKKLERKEPEVFAPPLPKATCVAVQELSHSPEIVPIDVDMLELVDTENMFAL